MPPPRKDRDKDKDEGSVVAGDKAFRHILRDRILVEMLRSAKGSAGDWKILITDQFTLRVISSSCKMPDVTEEGVSLIEDIGKRRQPQPSMHAVYFIQPSQLSLSLFKNDMQGREPLYKRAHVFFSRPLPKEFLQVIKDDPQLRSRIAALREMNLEVLTVDMQGFVTDNGDALKTLFGADINARDYDRAIHDIASRLATVFASLKEFPSVRYKAAKVSSAGAGSPQRMRDMVASKLAAALWERLGKYKGEIHGFPQRESCDLIIVDRTLDPIAPVIHDWSYGGMVYDLLPMDGNKYEYETAGDNGKRDKKTALLDEHDPIWLEVRHLFLAEAYSKVNDMFKQISSKLSTRDDLSGSELQELVRNIAMYRDNKEKIELHIKISGNLQKQLQQRGLMDVGLLEQGFVFGDKSATYKELSQVLKDKEDELDPYSKLRLLLVYAATHPDKLDKQKMDFWGQLACLGPQEMEAVSNLDLMGVPLAFSLGKEAASIRGGLGLNFGHRQHGGAGHQRKERKGMHEGSYELARFYPLLLDVLEDMHSSTLSTQDYPFVQEPPWGVPALASSAAPALKAAAAPAANAAAAVASAFQGLSIRPGGAKAAGAAALTATGAGAGGDASAVASGGRVQSVRRKSARAGSDDMSSSSTSNSNSSSSTSTSSGSSYATWALKPAKEGSDQTQSSSISTVRSGPGVAGGSVRGSSVRSGASARSESSSQPQLGANCGGAKGRRLFVFVVGGMTRSEVRVAHELSKKLGRDVIIGSTSVDTPVEFVEKMKQLRKK